MPDLDSLDLLSDPRTGLAGTPERGPLPRLLPMVDRFRARVHLLTGSTALTACGAALLDPVSAHAACLAEAAERYCATRPVAAVATAGHAELGRAGVDPETLVLHTAEQYARPGFPVVPFTADVEVEWTAARRSRDGTAVLAPVGVVSLLPSRPAVALVDSAGVAAARTAAQARTSAAREIIERDQLATAWHRADPLPRLPLPDRWAALLAEHKLDGRLHLVPGRFQIPVMLAVVRDPGRELLGAGSACRRDPGAAADKALTEAVVSLLGAIELDDAEAPALTAAVTPAGPLHEHRPDRDYLSVYRSDLTDVLDIRCHAQLYLDPVLQRRLLERLAAEPAAVRFPKPGPEPLAELIRHCPDTVEVDLTTPDVAAAGLVVWRLVAPGTRSTGPAGAPRLAGLGSPESLCLDPIPVA